MKKLIALSAAALLASSASIAAVSLSGSASVQFDDNGDTSGDTDYTYAAELVIAASSGATSVSATINLLDGTAGSVSMTTSIGPVSITADMTDDTAGAVDERGITLSLDVLAGDVNIALDDKGNATVTTTVAGVSISHVIGGETSASATLAGMDVNVSTDGTWDVSTTLNGVTLKIDNAGAVTASMGLAGNTVTITNAGDTVVSVSRDLTSGASLTATYATVDSSLTLKASVSF